MGLVEAHNQVNRTMKFQTRLMAGLTALLILTTGFFAATAALAQARAVAVEAEERLEAEAMLHEQAVDAMLRESKQLVHAFARNAALAEGLANDSLSSAFLESLRSGFPEARAVHAMDRAGVVVASTSGRSIPFGFSTQRAMDVTNVDVVDGVRLNVMYGPVLHGGDWVGHVLVESESSFSSFQGDAGGAWLAQRHSLGALVLNEEAEDWVVPYARINSPLIRGLDDELGIQEAKLGETPVLAFVRHLLEPDLVLVTAIPLSSLAQSMREVFFFHGAIAAGGLLLSLSGAYFVSASVARPLRRLREQVQSAGPSRPFEAKPLPGATLEVRELAHSFGELQGHMQAAVDGHARLLNMVSHELNTPLTPAAVELEMLQSGLLGPLSEEQLASLAAIERQIVQVSGITSEMLALSRMGNDPTEAVDVAEVVKASVGAYRRVASNAGIDFVVSVAPARVAGSRGRLGQVLENLLSNAVKYSPRGGSVQVSGERWGDAQYRVSVRDEGIGLRPGQEEEIFAPFVRVHDAHDSSAPGTGLGLYVVKRIVSHFGGKVWAESQGPGQGTKINILLPIKETQ